MRARSPTSTLMRLPLFGSLGRARRVGLWLTLLAFLLECIYPPCVKTTSRMVGADVPGNGWQALKVTRLRGFVFDIYPTSVESWSEDPGPGATEIGPSSL